MIILSSSLQENVRTLQEPNDTSAFVRMPALRARSCRSNPMSAPSPMLSRMRRVMVNTCDVTIAVQTVMIGSFV